MIEGRIHSSKDCMGCTACSSICPTDCIEMKVRKNGFSYPSVDNTQCIACKQCLKVCPMDKAIKSNTEEVYACINNNDYVRSNSSSGGFFNALADYTITINKGVVFGASFDSNIYLRHIKIENKEQIQDLMGSKYLNSDLGNSFREVKTLLNEGRHVLFTGLPCQVAGLTTFLNKEYDNLLTMDIICHGVPSKVIFSKYIDSIERKYGKIKNYRFRSKSRGWYGFETRIQFMNGYEISRHHWKDPFMILFLKNITLMDACYCCKFKGSRKSSDIHVGDFWRGEKVHKQFDDDKGTSVVIIQSEKGRIAFEKIKNKLIFEKTQIDYVEKNNSAINEPVNIPKFRKLYLKSIDLIGVKSTSVIILLLDKAKYVLSNPRKVIRRFLK